MNSNGGHRPCRENSELEFVLYIDTSLVLIRGTFDLYQCKIIDEAIDRI